MKVVCISDTHELHRDLNLPFADLLIHAGDFTFFGRDTRAIVDFNDWLGELPHPHKVVVPGNHEYILESKPELAGLITNATLLVNTLVIINGVKIWGSPLTPHHVGAFGGSNARNRAQIYGTIPLDTDILVTHGPPYGVLDSCPSEYPGPSGDVELRKAVVRVRPKMHIFGHVHVGYGVRPTKHTVFVNAALFGLDGSLDKAPILLDLLATKPH